MIPFSPINVATYVGGQTTVRIGGNDKMLLAAAIMAVCSVADVDVLDATAPLGMSVERASEGVDAVSAGVRGDGHVEIVMRCSRRVAETVVSSARRAGGQLAIAFVHFSAEARA